MKITSILCALAISAILISCGPSSEEIKKMQEEATRTFDSLSKAAEKKLAEDLERKDSVSVADTIKK